MNDSLVHPNLLSVIPFVSLLVAIGLAPLSFADWWGRHYPKVCAGLAALVIAYYLFGLNAFHNVLKTGEEYVSFMALVGSLFVVSGGIHIRVKGEATPLVNTA